MAGWADKQKWDIPITAINNPRDFEQHKKIVEDVMAGMDAEEQRILSQARFTRIDIRGDVPPQGASFWRPKERTVSLSTSLPDNSELPVFMRPISEHSFEFRAAHELYHPVIFETQDIRKHHDPAFIEARQKAIERINSDPEVAEKVEQVLTGMKAWLVIKDKSFLDIDFGWDKLEPANKQQMAVMLGVLMSDEYHEVYPYSQNVLLMRPDTRYDEMVCNTKALTRCYGEEAMRELAPEMLDYIASLHEKRGVADDKPKGQPETALERIERERRNKNGHSGHGGSMSR